MVLDRLVANAAMVVDIKPDLTLDSILGFLATCGLVGVTWYYARRSQREAAHANEIAAKAETERLAEVRRQVEADRRLAEAEISIAAFGLHRQLDSWIRGAPAAVARWADAHVSAIAGGWTGDELRDLIPVGVGEHQAVADWLTAHTSVDLDRAEARIAVLARCGPRARPDVEDAIVAIVVAFYEATRRMNEQHWGHAAFPEVNSMEIAKAYEDLRVCKQLLVHAVADRLWRTYESRSTAIEPSAE